ncbi:MAG TPA: hypothetical protein VFJ58_17110 [Armatimonadota bacterium]|nr:hypothetical protein [Armatimonadota bacterium]
MDGQEPTVYDPESAKEHAGAFGDLALEITLKDLSRPESVKLMVLMLRTEREETQALKNQIMTLREENQKLSAEHSDLRVQAASSKTRADVTLLEIPAGLLTGLGISLLISAQSATSWIILILGVIMLFYIRVVPLLGRGNHRDEKKG